MKKLLLLLLFIPGLSFAQKSTGEVMKKLGPSPMTILDSMVMSREDFFKTPTQDIATLTIITDTNATKAFGDRAKDGIIIAETKGFARKHYIAFFRRRSAAYDSLYSITKSDSTFQYIVNDKVKYINYEGDLSFIKDSEFISLEIITVDELRKKYHINDKKYGIVIYYKKPVKTTK